MAKEGLSAAFYKVNLHCPECAEKIKRPLLKTQGVRAVDVNFEKSEVKVVGVIDSKKIHQRIERLSKRKVELLKVEANFKHTVVVEKVVKETKEPVVFNHTVKAHLHCDQCEADLRRKLLRHKGIYNVKSDMKAQTLAIEGTIEAEKLVKHIREKLHKHAEIVKGKEIKKEEKKIEETKTVTKVEETKTATKVIGIEEVKEVQEKLKASNTPYIIHYVYAPQWFSDEDPNACSIM
ncbi:heavy metal-associated isoprenylated plant protein 4 [Amaranthus tricolor]|uniref:heavy metal-associated isoprenylated plant protein 4 n=1 Tax=Amaranthus tricolor TaxID=29722 RepID=UPI0025834649|nr:heavy metal-associated isoprenylated plant protein 4 [Amaranthus tricolor]XP_057531512.1 heavy metal-associated isoprenylated plant protein 4 [Amaranthus tricolor]XP_057531513.1 heavy metal-associated isoprenylated plant protein 4 [Amaranthus tricolor]